MVTKIPRKEESNDEEWSQIIDLPGEGSCANGKKAKGQLEWGINEVYKKKKSQPLPLCMYISRVLPTPVVVFVKSLNCFARQSDTFAWTFRLWGAVQAAHSLAFVGVYSLLKLRRQMVLVLPPTPPLPLSPPPLFSE